VPAYPLWVWALPARETRALRELYSELVAQAIAVPGPEVDRLAAAARAAKVAVAIGVNEVNVEASGSTLYNTLLVIDAGGRLIGRHRKMVPTAGERLVHAQGDGSTLAVHDLGFARLGGLICWENYMPLARYAQYAWGAQIWVAPTWDCGEPWLSTLRHVAKEGRCYVIGCCSAMRVEDVPERFGWRTSLARADGWINPGDSAIVDPDGKLLAGPAHQEAETILYAEVKPADMVGPRWQLDVAGHYARPDVFELVVRRRPKPLVRVDEAADAGEAVG
jgi:nitrilase